MYARLVFYRTNMPRVIRILTSWYAFRNINYHVLSSNSFAAYRARQQCLYLYTVVMIMTYANVEPILIDTVFNNYRRLFHGFGDIARALCLYSVPIGLRRRLKIQTQQFFFHCRVEPSYGIFEPLDVWKQFECAGGRNRTEKNRYRKWNLLKMSEPIPDRNVYLNILKTKTGIGKPTFSNDIIFWFLWVLYTTPKKGTIFFLLKRRIIEYEYIYFF